MKNNKQLFFSHTWRPDNLGRNTHLRVFELVKKLRDCGWKTWFDEEDMKGNIDAAMADGIDNADVVLVCLTETYCKKVNETAKNLRTRDNCLKEWTYANARNKLMIPIVMEPYLLNPINWPAGIVSLYLGSTLYLDASKDDLEESVIFINKYLLKQGLQPNNNIKKIFTDIIINNTIKNQKSSSPISNKKSSSPISNKKSSSPISNKKSLSSISSFKSLQCKFTSKMQTFIPEPPTKFYYSKLKSPRKRIHRPAPMLPTNILSKTISTIETMETIETNKNKINSQIIIHKKPGNFSNRRISEMNVLSNHIPNINMKKSISTGNFLNLCI